MAQEPRLSAEERLTRWRKEHLPVGRLRPPRIPLTDAQLAEVSAIKSPIARLAKYYALVEAHIRQGDTQESGKG